MTTQERAAELCFKLALLVDAGTHMEVDTDAMKAIADALTATRRDALLEVSRRLLPNAQSAMLDAPCLWCGYNGEGYWQPTTHELTCLWHNVGGRFDRVVALDRLAQEG